MKNTIESLLQTKRDQIIEAWLEVLYQSYPDEGAKFFRGKSDQFQNPVGYAISNGIEILYAGIVAGQTGEEQTKALDGILRIRSIQDLSPSAAIQFILQLKTIIKHNLPQPVNQDVLEQLLVLNETIDQLLLQGLDVYMKCREQLFEIRNREFKSRYFKILERAQLKPED